ncbi:hypothetical protein Megvenef_00670 [Candidatus Megaera venefica]|uniref:Uncharacterized protein n=1 Tax=Candidatus Megaera venefica TaxID=2055910 RepID=A0ABU5NC36_9RICK|nr:hypothetical protein [Candidatus Megaera venefica]MEA0970702.1 hypothetical protein [Candidatus Megaera venefica]
MSGTTEEIRDTLTFILNKLQTIDSKLDRQEEDIKAYIECGLVNLDSNELLIAGLKSTRTSFELLRDEIDELHQLTVALFKGEQE